MRPAGPDTTSRISGAAQAYRGDIDGLRALAVLLIVAYHAGLPGFAGGFIGVDVFIVISGYLISRNLLSESDRTGRIAMRAFWARRIRRLVPGLGLMIVSVFGLAAWTLSAVEWSTVAQQGRLAALYVSNIRFALDSADYFAQDIHSSLFLHTWSLGVEEQFYLIWPVVFVVVLGWTSKRPESRRSAFVAVFGAIFAVSLAGCFWLTMSGSGHAFFGLPARAWEFAAAGLLGVRADALRCTSRRQSTLLALLGFGGLGLALAVLDAETVYPGPWPLIPVLATVCLIAAGSAGSDGHVSSINRALTNRFLLGLGAVSYSWYLWHWPLVVLATIAFDSGAWTVTVPAAAASLAVAVAAHRLVENPVRFHSGLIDSQRATYAMGVVVTAIVLLASFGLERWANSEVDRGHLTSALSDPSPMSGPQGTASRTDALRSLTALPRVSLAEVRGSRKRDECGQWRSSPTGVRYCNDGDRGSNRTILLVGDSHAQHWMPAFSEAARRSGIRLVTRALRLCPAFEVRTITLDGRGENFGCQEFRAGTQELITELQPTAVVVANSSNYGFLVVSDQPDASGGPGANRAMWSDRYARFGRSLRDRGIRFGGIVDTPRMPFDPLACVVRKGVEACTVSKDIAFKSAAFAEAERAARERLGEVAVLDVNDLLCDGATCSPVLSGTYVYADADHLFREFALTLVEPVRLFFDALLAPREIPQSRVLP